MFNQIKIFCWIILLFQIKQSFSQQQNDLEDQNRSLREKIMSKDNQFYTETRSRLKNEQEKIKQMKDEHSKKCKENVYNCRERYKNYKDCYNQIPYIEKRNEIDVIKGNQEEYEYSKEQCLEITNNYLNYQKILLNYISNTKEVISYLKSKISHKEYNEPSYNAEKRNKTQETIDLFFDNFGQMFYKSYVDMSNLLDENINKDNFMDANNIKNIKKIVDSIKDNNDQNKFIRQSLTTFSNILADFENGYYKINSTFTKSIKKCTNKMEKELQKETLHLNREYTKMLEGNLTKLETHFNASFTYLCDLMKKNYFLCNELEDYCHDYQKHFDYEIEQIDDLILYFSNEDDYLI